MATASSYSFNQVYNQEDEDELQSFVVGRDATIAVIDCNSSMFDMSNSSEKSKNLFEKCLYIIQEYLLDSIIKNHKNLFGIILYNTEKSPEPKGNVAMKISVAVPENCAVLVPVEQIEKTVIQYIMNLRQSEDLMDFDNRIGHSNDSKIADVLWLCSTLFATTGKKIQTREILWFSNWDLPHKVGQIEHQQAFQKAKDLQQLQFDVKFYPMAETFNGDLFYKELLCQVMDLESDEFDFPSHVEDEDEIVQNMFKRGYRKRAMTYLNVEIRNAKFGVGVYAKTRKTKSKPKPVTLSRDNEEEIVKRRTMKYAFTENNNPNQEDDEHLDPKAFHDQLDFQQKLEPSLAVKYQIIGGEKVRFTTLEAFEIKQVMDPKIKIVGFKPREEVEKFHRYAKAPSFLYPHDERLKNSSVFFRALWEHLLEEDKVAICICTLRFKSYPRMVALIPYQQEIIDDEIVGQDVFKMITMPYSDNIRNLEKHIPEATEDDEDEDDEQIEEIFKRLITKLKIQYAPTMFDNPVAAKIYRKVEAAAFNEDSRGAIDPIPNIEAQDKRIEKIIGDLQALVGEFEVNPVALKRKTTSANGDGVDNNNKRPKVGGDWNFEEILSKCQSGDIKNITVQMLKDYLAVKKVTGVSKLNKTQLVEKILNLN